MASYFDLPPQQNAPAPSIEQVPVEQRKQLGGMSLMSPAVTQILEGLGDDHSDSSSSEEDGSSEEEEPHDTTSSSKNLNAQKVRNNQKHIAGQAPRPSSLSPNRAPSSNTNKGSSHGKQSAARASGDSSVKSKQKQPGMARFHSLRSMLFQANIEDRMKTVSQEDENNQDAATKWKAQHENRQMHHPNASEKDTPSKTGLGNRIRMTVRRMTTKDAAGGMEKIREDGAPVEFNDRASTASSDNDSEVEQTHQQNPPRKRRTSSTSSINHSDVDDLVRWVSQRSTKENTTTSSKDKEDSGTESLAHSDVEELVRYASRRSVPQLQTQTQESHTGYSYSDASTESDSPSDDDDIKEEDVESLTRWISHRDGASAGPIRQQKTQHNREDVNEDVEIEDEDVPELGRWFKRSDGTSGESSPVRDVVDDEERGRPRSRDSLPPAKEEIKEDKGKEERSITNDDVDELVRWISRKESR